METLVDEAALDPKDLLANKAHLDNLDLKDRKDKMALVVQRDCQDPKETVDQLANVDLVDLQATLDSVETMVAKDLKALEAHLAQLDNLANLDVLDPQVPLEKMPNTALAHAELPKKETNAFSVRFLIRLWCFGFFGCFNKSVGHLDLSTLPFASEIVSIFGHLLV